MGELVTPGGPEMQPHVKKTAIPADGENHGKAKDWLLNLTADLFQTHLKNKIQRFPTANTCRGSVRLLEWHSRRIFTSCKTNEGWSVGL